MDVVLLIVIVVLLLGAGVGFFFFHRYYKQQLNLAMRRAQKSEQLKAVFIDNACHTLRTPLNAISGYSTMILETPDAMMKPEEVREMAGNIEKDSKQLLGFVDQLVELSRFEGITPSFTFIEVNLTELMASYRREALNYTKPDVAIHVRTDLSPHCKGTLDTNFMHQLMMHLLKNAAVHTTQGDIIVRYGYERKGIRVAISYTGIGQAEMIGTDIYAFLQKENALANVNESSALGLATCKAIVEVLGGEFYIETEANSKTVATFWFPCKMRDKRKDLYMI